MQKVCLTGGLLEGLETISGIGPIGKAPVAIRSCAMGLRGSYTKKHKKRLRKRSRGVTRKVIKTAEYNLALCDNGSFHVLGFVTALDSAKRRIARGRGVIAGIYFPFILLLHSLSFAKFSRR